MSRSRLFIGAAIIIVVATAVTRHQLRIGFLNHLPLLRPAFAAAQVPTATAILVQSYQIVLPSELQTSNKCGPLSIRRVVTNGDGLRFLASLGCSQMAPGGSLIADASPNGVSHPIFMIPPVGYADFQSLTSGHLLVFTVSKTGSLFQEVTNTGTELTRNVETNHTRKVAILDDALVSIHADGTVALTPIPLGQHALMTAARVIPTSLATSLLLPMQGGRIAIVHQDSADLEIYEVNTGRATTSHVRSPELEAARTRYQQIAQSAPPNTNIATGLVVADATIHQDAIYLLTAPYDPRAGALVMRVASDGSVTQQWRCKLNSSDDPAKAHPPIRLAFAGDRACLVSLTGNVGCFAL